MRAKERVRGELQAVHAQELQARDDLVQLLKAQVAELERRPALDNGHRGSGQVAKVSQSGGQVSGRGSSQSPGDEDEHQALLTSVPEGGNSETPVRKLTLPPLPKFTGEKAEEDAFERWTRRLLRHAELEKWTDRERLLQLEIHLAGRAEQVYEVLMPEGKATFSKAVDALKQRLQPVRSEALLSVQLMRRKQRDSELVEGYAQDFESLFEKSYGRRSGMDDAAKEMLKSDLFVQGLILKWQEKVLPSAATFSDALHQARLAEEQSRQLSELHKGRLQERTQPKKVTWKATEPKSAGGETIQRETSGTPTPTTSRPREPGRCYRCGSLRHKARECPQRQTPTESPVRAGTRAATSSSVTAAPSSQAESLEDKCLRLQQDPTLPYGTITRGPYVSEPELSSLLHGKTKPSLPQHTFALSWPDTMTPVSWGQM